MAGVKREIVFDEKGNLRIVRRKNDISERQIAMSLVKNKGFFSAVAKELGTTTAYIKKRIAKSTVLLDIIETIEDTIIDLCEVKLVDLIKDGNFEAIKFYLKSKAKERGYTDQVNLAGGDGKSLSINITPVLPKPEEKKCIDLNKN